jgi:hypothetical protein
MESNMIYMVQGTESKSVAPVGDMRSYADVVRGTAKESSNVTDTVHHTTRQTVVTGKCKQQQ